MNKKAKSKQESKETWLDVPATNGEIEEKYGTYSQQLRNTIVFFCYDLHAVVNPGPGIQDLFVSNVYFCFYHCQT